jgi:hypothetical protein
MRPMIFRPFLSLIALSLLVFLELGSPCSAQTKSNELDFLLGEWKGEGCDLPAKHSCNKVSQTVKVQRDPNGNSLKFEDRMRPKYRESQSDIYLKGAFAYDESSQLWAGNFGRANLRGRLLKPNTFQWEEQSEFGIRRTTVMIANENEWHQATEMRLSKGWVQTYESVLRKSK